MDKLSQKWFDIRDVYQSKNCLKAVEWKIEIVYIF